MFRRLVLAFFIAATLLAHAQTNSWNVTSRLAAIESLVDRHTFAIDRSPFVTGDKYLYNGHFYSDKPPVFNLAGAAIAVALRAVKIDIVRQSKIVLVPITIVLIALPFALAVGTLFALLRLLGVDERWAASVATIAGSATLAFPYATVLINHVPAAALLLAALYVLARVRRDGHATAPALAGMILAIGVGIDTSFVVFLVLAPIVLGRPTPRAYLVYAAGAIPVLGVLALTNLGLSGNVRPPDTNAPLFDWPGSKFAHGNLAGTVVHRTPAATLAYAFNMLAGVRGLFLYSPILVFGVYALVLQLRDRGTTGVQRTMATFVAVATTLYVASAVIATIDFGGYAYGMRTFVSISFLLCIPLGSLASALRERGTLRRAFLATLVVSIVFALAGVLDTFSASPFPLVAALPNFARFVQAHRVHGLLDLIAFATIGIVAYVVVRRSLLRPSKRRPRAYG